MLACTTSNNASTGVIIHRFLVIAILLLAGDALAGADPLTAHRQRVLTTVQLLCEGFADAKVSAAFPELTLGPAERITRGDAVLGWRRRMRFADGSHALVERIAPREELRRLSVELSDHQSRPRLAAIATPDCVVVNARLIEYDNSNAVHLRLLDSQLHPQGEPIPMNPPLPPGRDAQGTTVALVDSGVNYLLPAIAKHLARDPRGRPLGFDFWDMDPRPFDAHPVHSVFFPQRHGTRIASIILREAPGTRLIPYRYPRPDMRRMRELVKDAASAGARVVNLSLGGKERDQWTSFEQIARQHTDLLFVASAGNNGRDIDTEPVYPASLELDNMLTVTSADTDGYPARGSNWGRKSVDLLVPGEQIPATGFTGMPRDVSGSSYAAARITALASRILLDAPELDARALRESILSMARSAPGAFVSGGWISEPADLARERDARSLRVVASTDWPHGAANRSRFQPALVILNDSGWDAARVRRLVEGSAEIIQQCGITMAPARLIELAAADSVRDFSRSNAKLLIQKIGTRGPRVFFVRDTLDRPAFEAFTFGTTNSKHNPDLRFTVWMTAATRDPRIALAHELAHMLLDNGSHTREPRNLMRSDTAPGNVELTEQQCSTMRDTALQNGLLE